MAYTAGGGRCLTAPRGAQGWARAVVYDVKITSRSKTHSVMEQTMNLKILQKKEEVNKPWYELDKDDMHPVVVSFEPRFGQRSMPDTNQIRAKKQELHLLARISEGVYENLTLRFDVELAGQKKNWGQSIHQGRARIAMCTLGEEVNVMGVRGQQA
ncbi:hypothetical protein M011DRAFT_480545 [Sporormia fimetaria CBS 119925]|uniref:Uncharacterized protein n=1 Tax=Sporormia fimetaria CBS 119925 TaxID=1340428 RepID=A0A6A6V1W5_9PLEO|nr:hypothetical protein M011DRAFT_480545 [Sporormia fimetaria CBS 119925]